MTIKDFHKHLDICDQCRNHPFNLCSIGVTLINKMKESLYDYLVNHANN